MEVDAFLADAVESVQGKLYAMGIGWNVINVLEMPTRHARTGIGVIIRVPYTATNQQHSFEVRLEDGDGQPVPIGDASPQLPTETEDGKIRKLGGAFNVGRPPTLQPGDEQIVPLAVNLDGLLFERETSYQFVISVDGTDLKKLPFRIVHQKMPVPIVG